ncbi:MAG: DUF669 domain-containing protein [Synergistaceae bacterium]
MALLAPELTQDLLNTKAEDFTPIPAGEYTLQVTKANVEPTKNGTGLIVKAEFDVIGPSHQGRKIFGNFNIRNESAMAEKIGKQQLKSLMVAGHVQEPLVDTDQLLGATVRAGVIIRPESGQYAARNEVKSFKEVGASASNPLLGAPVMSATPTSAVQTSSTAPMATSFSNAFASQAKGSEAPQWGFSGK